MSKVKSFSYDDSNYQKFGHKKKKKWDEKPNHTKNRDKDNKDRKYDKQY